MSRASRTVTGIASHFTLWRAYRIIPSARDFPFHTFVSMIYMTHEMPGIVMDYELEVWNLVPSRGIWAYPAFYPVGTSGISFSLGWGGGV
jgi:hypothetical protein